MSRAQTRSRRPQAGLTLIEVMVALAILSFMLMLTWTTTSTSASSKKRFEAVQERNHELRMAMVRMVKDIEGAYVSGNEDTSQDNRRTLFIGDSQRPVDELRLSSLAHRVLWENANESEQTLISYMSAPDPQDSSKTNLLRRESRRLSNEPWESEPAEVDILLRDIERVSFEYFDWRDNEWQDSWDSVGADGQPNRLPERVRITVTLENAAGDQVKRVTQARIMLQERLDFLN